MGWLSSSHIASPTYKSADSFTTHLRLRPAFHTVNGLSVLCSGLTAAFHVQVSLYQEEYGRSQYRGIELFFSMTL